MREYVDIDFLTLEGEKCWAYNLDFVKENSRSIYAKSPMYGWVYRIEKTTGKIFLDKEYIGTRVKVLMW